jgi:hypothetical protein
MKMNVSFNGMRRNATRAMNDLKDVLDTAMMDESCQNIDVDFKIAIVEKFNRAAFMVDSFNCLFDPDVDGDMDDLSNELSVITLEDIEEN